MRIVIDLQGAQSSGSRNRGIGRYTHALTEALIRQRGEHEVLLVLNGLFADTIEPLRAHFDALLPQSQIRVWYGLPGSLELGPTAHPWRREASELMREAFLRQQRPDLVLVTSLFEGLVDDAVTSIGRLRAEHPTAVILYDLIPLVHRQPYLDNPTVAAWYEGKLAHLRQAQLLLSISDASRQEAMVHLAIEPQECVSISTAADARFRPITLGDRERADVLGRHRLDRPFVMYTGGIDHRKNIEGLIRAFARLPAARRQAHQLAIVCSASEPDRQRLLALAATEGLTPDDVRLTGFVSDDDLLALYNLCTLFVFPSWHEGFGLPALEAMSCGRPVIAAATSSLPEVVGLPEALFDPFDDGAMADKIDEVLSDPALHERLARHGLARSRNFSWDQTAARALKALESLAAAPVATTSAPRSHRPAHRPSLAVVSPLPPDRTGIADYNAELLPELARHFDITVIAAEAPAGASWAPARAPIESPAWLERHADRFDHVLYQVGNSHFHRHMLDLIVRVPGIVILHDFYLGHLVEHLHGTGKWRGERSLSLHRCHGYPAVAASLAADGVNAATWAYPCNADLVRAALGVIVHSENARALAADWFGAQAAADWAVVPLLRAPMRPLGRMQARRALGLAEDCFVVCSFGLVGPSKLSQRVLRGFSASRLARDPRCLLLFVGDNHAGVYGAELAAAIDDPALGGRVKVTGWTSAADYDHYLVAADVAVQLRGQSRGESSRAVFDCLNASLATVVNAHGSLAELPPDAAVQLPESFEDRQLADALDRLWIDPEQRRALALRGRHLVETQHRPRTCAALYATAIETMQRRADAQLLDLPRALARLPNPPRAGAEWTALARALAHNDRDALAPPQLLVDVSVLARVDARTGIQRVVRSILAHWLSSSQRRWRVEPVYAADDGSYRYARSFAMDFLGAPATGAADAEIDARQGDALLLLDLFPGLQPAHLAIHQALRRQGVGVRFVVYDLLPVQLPHRFPAGVPAEFQNWLRATAQSDGVICISRAVADEYVQWLGRHDVQRGRDFTVDWFHLGADIAASKPSQGLPEGFDRTLATLRRHKAVLMVGTIEPRKRHDLVLAAMERRWAGGGDEVLVIVGKLGWGREDFAGELRAHPQAGRRLFWFERASDEWLERLYQVSAGLIVASEGEGFGLSIVEAQRHGIPVFARDLPVLREVANEGAHFFVSDEAAAFDLDLDQWLGTLPTATSATRTPQPMRAWSTSADELMACLSASTHHAHWRPDRLRWTLGPCPARADGLRQAPPLALGVGGWRLRLKGAHASDAAGGSHAEVVDGATGAVLARSALDADGAVAGALATLQFKLTEACADLRLLVAAPATVRIDGLEIQRAGANAWEPTP